MSWPWIIALAVGAYGFKLLGVSAGSALRRWESLTRLLPVALFTGLIVVLTFDGGQTITFDARLAGIAAGGIVAWRRGPFAVVIAVAMLVTAGVRALSG